MINNTININDIYIQVMENFDIYELDCLDQDEKEIFLKSYVCLLDLSLKNALLGEKNFYKLKKDYQDIGLLPNDDILDPFICFLNNSDFEFFQEFLKHEKSKKRT